MKFMKLGSKPDAFQSDGKNIRRVSSDLVTDCSVIVGDVKFYLHKFPLLSKSNHMQKLVQKADEDESEEIHIVDFPGGPKAFEICAKFCYGMTVTLNAYNVVATRCAAEYLQMTEDVDRGNLIFKIEVFLNSGIFRSWKDSIIVLQTTKSLLPWSEEIIGRCVDSIASKTSVDPTNITWSYTHNRKLAIVEHGMKLQDKIECVPKDWWVEDICELEIDQYKRVMIAVKSKGRMDENVIGEALKTYTIRWLPDSVDDLVSDAHRSLVETITWLLPSDKGVGCSCTFLLNLLKAAILTEANDLVRENLVERISLKLHEASVNDLLITARPPQMTKYDVELVQCIVNRFVNHFDEKAGHGIGGFSSGHGSLLMVGGLVDGYLAEIAKDPNLTISCFMNLSVTVPESARPLHNGLYKAIDVYLKEHPGLTKAERKKISGIMDVKKLTADASMHAAQNERLPLRVVVQVLFFEQVRAAAGAQALNKTRSSLRNNEEEWQGNEGKSLEMSKEKDMKKNSRSGAQLLPSRSRRIFDKLWGVGRGQGENRSSETSGSSQSPTSQAPKSSARNRRHSIS